MGALIQSLLYSQKHVVCVGVGTITAIVGGSSVEF